MAPTDIQETFGSARDEHQLRTIIDSIPAQVWCTCADGRAEFLNRRWLEYTGLSLEEGLDWGWTAAIHPNDRDRIVDHWRLLLSSGHSGEIEVRLRRFDGDYRWFRAWALPMQDSAGRIIRWFNLNTDIDDQRSAEAALRASEQHFHSIVDRIPGFVCTMKPTGEVESVNRQIVEYFGRSVDDLRQWTMTDAVHPDDLPRAIAGWTRAIEIGERYQIELRLRRADGVYRWFHLDALPVHDADGRILRWYDLLTDTEERKQVDEQLRRSEGFLLEAQRLSHTGSWRHDLSTGAVTTSPEMLRMWGVRPEEDSSASEFWFDRIHPDDRLRVQGAFADSEREKRDYEADYRILLPDGAVRYHHSVGHAVVNESGDLSEFVGTAMDVTEQ
jgi:PAS domain S-box-containing protein